MESPQLFNKILFPTDFSKQSNLALKFVVDLAQKHNSDLIILHTFRLTGGGAKDKTLVNAKRDLELDAISEFKMIDEKYLKQSPLQYVFYSEVGFISDRIISNVEEHQVDLVVLCSSIQEKIMERVEMDYASLIKDINCPVLMVPLEPQITQN